jgi:hypothetical protein
LYFHLDQWSTTAATPPRREQPANNQENTSEAVELMARTLILSFEIMATDMTAAGVYGFGRNRATLQY